MPPSKSSVYENFEFHLKTPTLNHWSLNVTSVAWGISVKALRAPGGPEPGCFLCHLLFVTLPGWGRLFSRITSGGLCNKGECYVLFLQGQLCREGRREISLLPPSISHHVASHCSMMALVLQLFAVVSCHYCFLVCLKSERDCDTAIMICSIYSVGFFMASYRFPAFHSHLDKKTQTKPASSTRRVE